MPSKAAKGRSKKAAPTPTKAPSQQNETSPKNDREQRQPPSTRSKIADQNKAEDKKVTTRNRKRTQAPESSSDNDENDQLQSPPKKSKDSPKKVNDVIPKGGKEKGRRKAASQKSGDQDKESEEDDAQPQTPKRPNRSPKKAGGKAKAALNQKKKTTETASTSDVEAQPQPPQRRPPKKKTVQNQKKTAANQRTEDKGSTNDEEEPRKSRSMSPKKADEKSKAAGKSKLDENRKATSEDKDSASDEDDLESQTSKRLKNQSRKVDDNMNALQNQKKKKAPEIAKDPEDKDSASDENEAPKKSKAPRKKAAARPKKVAQKAASKKKAGGKADLVDEEDTQKKEEEAKKVLIRKIKTEKILIKKLRETIELKKFEEIQHGPVPKYYSAKDVMDSLPPNYENIKGFKGHGESMEKLTEEVHSAAVAIGAELLELVKEKDDKTGQYKNKARIRLMADQDVERIEFAMTFTSSTEKFDDIVIKKLELMNGDVSEAVQECFDFCLENQDVVIAVEMLKLYQQAIDDRLNVVLDMRQEFDDFLVVKLRKEPNLITIRAGVAGDALVKISWGFRFEKMAFVYHIEIAFKDPQIEKLIEAKCGNLVKDLKSAEAYTDSLVTSLKEFLKCLKKEEKSLKRKSADI